MNKSVAGVFAAGFIFAGSAAFSDATQQDPMMNHKQMMKECMARMTAKNDGSTKGQMKTACKTEMMGGMSKGNTTKGESLVPGNMAAPSNPR
jgi:hypothetical protein